MYKVAHKCSQCGLCCLECGDMYNREGEGGICPQLDYDDNGKAFCKVEREIGRWEKPQVCKDYPFEHMDGKCKKDELADVQS